MATPKDKTALVLNPLTGEFDLVTRFNPDRLVTHSMNSAGNPLQILDPGSGQYVDLGDLLVTDSNGSVVYT